MSQRFVLADFVRSFNLSPLNASEGAQGGAGMSSESGYFFATFAIVAAS